MLARCRLRLWVPLTGSLVTGCLLVLAFPSFDLEWVAWIALVPLLLVIRNRSPLSAFGLGSSAGVVFFLGVLGWLTNAEIVQLRDFVLLCFYLGTYLGLFAFGIAVFFRGHPWAFWFGVPALWVGLEFFRAHLWFLEFPWALLGYTQHQNLPLIQIAAWTGVYGVSYLIILVNVALTTLLSEPRQAFRPVLSLVIVMVGLVSYGWTVMSSTPEGPVVRIAVVSGHVPQSERWDPAFWTRNYEKHVTSTLAVSREFSPSLIVWPETAVPYNVNMVGTDLPNPHQLARDTGGYLLFGTAGKAKFQGGKWKRARNRHNTALLISPEGESVDRYHKIKLFPFGEYLPYPSLIPWPSRAVSRAANFLPGQEHTLFSLRTPDQESVSFSTLICWETAFPDFVRTFVNRGANFLVNMTNEAWFEDAAFPEQFMSMTVFRAVENRVSVVRAANYGLSGFIDPYGRIIERGNLPTSSTKVKGTLSQPVAVSTERTFYSIYGDVFVWVNILVLGSLCAVTFFRVVRRRDLLIQVGLVTQIVHLKDRR